jgi:hypothetical protein
MCSELNLYNELKFQLLEETSRVALNKRIKWGHNKSNRDLYIVTNRKQTRLAFHVSVIAVGGRILRDRKFKWHHK